LKWGETIKKIIEKSFPLKLLGQFEQTVNPTHHPSKYFYMVDVLTK
jgi:hypothetical protein